MLLLDISDIEGLVGSEGPVLVVLVGELGLGVVISAELSGVVHGSLVGKDVLATGDNAHWLAEKLLRSLLLVDVVSELISMGESLFSIVDEAASLGELVTNVVASPVLVALVLLHDHNFGAFNCLTVSISLEAEESILFSMGQAAANRGAHVLGNPFFFVFPFLVS